MKIRHRVPVFEPKPVVIDDEYQAELDRMTAKAEKVYRAAVRAVEKSEIRARQAESRAGQQTADAAARNMADKARAVAIARYDELKRLEAQMQQTPVYGARHSGTGSVQRIHNRETM